MMDEAHPTDTALNSVFQPLWVRRGCKGLKPQQHTQRRNDEVEGIITPLSVSASDNIMEAEQLNAISNQLQDLGLRSAELRRYL
ncbi:MAG: hypothetical protein Q8J80_10140 [Gallionella sp.]|nr:hypothetical protein [Gallionella sp.]